MKLRIYALILGGLFCGGSLLAMDRVQSVEIDEGDQVAELNERLNYSDLAEHVKKDISSRWLKFTEQEIEEVYQRVLELGSLYNDRSKEEIFEDRAIPELVAEACNLSNSKKADVRGKVIQYLAPIYARKEAQDRRKKHGVGIKLLGRHWKNKVLKFGGTLEADDKLEELIWKYGITRIKVDYGVEGIFEYPYNEWLQFIKDVDHSLHEKATKPFNGFVSTKSNFEVTADKVAVNYVNYLNSEGNIVREEGQSVPEDRADSQKLAFEATIKKK